MRFLLSSFRLLIVLICLIFLLAICYFYLDIPLFLNSSLIRERFYIPLRVLSILTSPGTQLALWSLIFFWVLLIKKDAKFSLLAYPIIASMIASNTLIRFIKICIGRSRPDMLLYEGIYQLKLFSFERFFTSFPSGHASTFASIFGLFAAKYPKYALFWIFFAVALSLCRVFIGAHYLSDVLFGNYLGFAFTWYFYFKQLDKHPAFLNYTKDNELWNNIPFLNLLLKKDGQLEP
jgi:membrane-associated phospholipid phosphatase